MIYYLAAVLTLVDCSIIDWLYFKGLRLAIVPIIVTIFRKLSLKTKKVMRLSWRFFDLRTAMHSNVLLRHDNLGLLLMKALSNTQKLRI